MRKVFLIIAMALSAVTMSQAASYSLWVGFTHVTDANKNDILGNGMFSFDPTMEKLTIHGGAIDCTFPTEYQDENNGYRGYITTRILAYGASVYSDIDLQSLTINVEHSTTLTNISVPNDDLCRDAIYSTVPTFFEGDGTLALIGFYGHCVHVKNNLTFDMNAGSYIFQSGILPFYRNNNMEYASHCIYQEGSGYKLYLRGGQFILNTLSSIHSDRASVMRYDGGVDESGMGSVAYTSPVWGYEFEYRGGSSNWFNKLFHDRKYFSEMDQKSVSHYVYNGIQSIRSMMPKQAPVKKNNGGEWSELKDYYKTEERGNRTVFFQFKDDENVLILNNANVTLPNGLMCNLDQLTIQCYGTNTINYSGADYALTLAGKNILFQGMDSVASLTINAPACINTVYGFRVYTMTLNCLASGPKAINISSTSGNPDDHCISVNRVVPVSASGRVHATATQYPIYGIQKVDGGHIFRNGALANSVIVDDQGNAMTDVTIGNETIYPIVIDNNPLTPSLVEYYQDLYGKNNFVYDPTLQILLIRNVNAPNMRIDFDQVKNGTLQLYQTGTNNLKSIVVRKKLMISGNGTLNVNNPAADGKALDLAGNASVTFSATTANFTGGGYGVTSEENKPGYITINQSTVSFKGNTQSVKNIQSISNVQSALTAPANASFSAVAKSVVVNNIPTNEKVVYTRTDSQKPKFYVNAYIGEENQSEAEVKTSVTLSASVGGNGNSAGNFVWEKYNQYGDWIYATVPEQITAANLMSGVVKTTDGTVDEDMGEQLWRAIIYMGNDTLRSNVLTLKQQYKVTLNDDGYTYYLNDDAANAKSVTSGDTTWMCSTDTLTLIIDEDNRLCNMGFYSEYFWYEESLDGITYRYSDLLSEDEIYLVHRKLDIRFYSSCKQIDNNTLIKLNSVYCSSSLQASSQTVPDAPQKSSPFEGWMDMDSKMIYSKAQLDTMTLYYDKVFCAVYKGDFTVKYALVVNGDQVTSDNCDNILSDGTAYYDNGNKTLTLNNATISYAGDVIAAYGNINIECIGQNSVEATDKSGNALYEDAGSITILGTGSVNFKAQSAAINLQHDLTIKDGCSVTTESANSFALTSAGDSLTIDGATLIAKGNGKEATINGCHELIMTDGVEIRSAHSYDAVSHKFLNSQSQEAKDDIYIGTYSTGLEETSLHSGENKGEVSKFIKGGHLYIIQNDKMYNAQGQKL